MSDIEEALKAELKKLNVSILSEEDVEENEELGNGAYAQIFKGTLKTDNSKIVIKRIINPDYAEDIDAEDIDAEDIDAEDIDAEDIDAEDIDAEDIDAEDIDAEESDPTDLLFKEIKLLARMKHPNIVRLIGAVLDPPSAILERVRFNLNEMNIPQIKCSKKGHNLADLLRYLDRLKVVDEVGVTQGVLHKAAFDVAQGLSFLHEHDICHRDLKPDNVLVQNLMEEFTFKIADFGESRASNLQTGPVPRPATGRLKRGTIVFYAPEQVLKSLRLADLSDLKRVDVWGYGLIIFCLLSPDRVQPWQVELRSSSLKKLMTNKELPQRSDKHEYKDLPEHTGLGEVFTNCCQYDPASRPAMDDVMSKLTKMRDSHKKTGSSASPAAAAEHVDSGAQAGVVPENATQHPQKGFASEMADLNGWVSEHNTTWLDLDATPCHGMDAVDEGDIDDPTGICFLDHHIVVSDRKKNQVLLFQKTGPTGNYSEVSSLGGEGLDCFNEPRGICAGHNGKEVYVSDYGSHSVKEIDIAEDGQLRVLRELTAGGCLVEPTDVCTAYNSGQLLVACVDGVHVVDVTTGDIISTLPTPTSCKRIPCGVACRDGCIVVTHDSYTRLLVYTEPYTHGVVHAIQGLQSPRGIYIDNERNIFVADSERRCIFRFGINPGSASGYQVGSPYCKPWHMALDGEHLLITSFAAVLRADMAQFRPTP